ncbi:CFI-box-CTERM domain-containing protein [Burkholderia gladioli]|uniref:CFI-box-CTERM domain-containing protein n=1 Tax=Burkholderia gladioli TaxID=28095 RepID=UPI001641A079|nr:CFI-box-CTERM domain-containing protein [Burkholderia gladioli]
MGYYRGYGGRRRRSYRKWSGRSAGPSKYYELTKLFGGAVGAIQSAFLALEEEALDALLSDYGEIHGASPEAYARKAFPKWKSGATKLSGQTMERLVTLVPPYLAPVQRFEILRQVVEKHRPGTPYMSVHVDPKKPEEGFAKLDAVLATMKKEDILAHVPENVLAAASWLCDNDITAARALLAQAEGRNNEIMRIAAIEEVELLKSTVRAKQVQHATYSVEMPAGRLTVSVHKKSSCFVATACFGADSWETDTFRRWRDTVLIQHAAGRAFISWYYRNGPAIAWLARRVPGVLPMVRWVLRRFAAQLLRSEARRNGNRQLACERMRLFDGKIGGEG